MTLSQTDPKIRELLLELIKSNREQFLGCFLKILNSPRRELVARGLLSKFQQPQLSPQVPFSRCSSFLDEKISRGCLHSDTVGWLRLSGYVGWLRVEWLREWGRYKHPPSSPSLVTADMQKALKVAWVHPPKRFAQKNSNSTNWHICANWSCKNKMCTCTAHKLARMHKLCEYTAKKWAQLGGG